MYEILNKQMKMDENMMKTLIKKNNCKNENIIKDENWKKWWIYEWLMKTKNMTWSCNIHCNINMHDAHTYINNMNAKSNSNNNKDTINI